jgi:hypothetical protein
VFDVVKFHRVLSKPVTVESLAPAADANVYDSAEPSVVRLLICRELSAVFVNHPLPDFALTVTPLAAFVPISMSIDPSAETPGVRSPKLISFAERVILSVGKTLAFTWIPLTVPEAVPGNDSSHIIAVSKELSPSTVQVPICCAA